MGEELRECPFCGGEDVEHLPDGFGNWLVGCVTCDYRIQCFSCTEDDAIRYWNTRPAEDALKAEITRYRRALHNLKEDCTKRKHFAVSDEEKLFLAETILHIEAELDFNPDTEKGGEDE